jgi:hypothetical protein
MCHGDLKIMQSYENARPGARQTDVSNCAEVDVVKFRHGVGRHGFRDNGLPRRSVYSSNRQKSD